jgi:hypothetical protein
MDSPSPLADLRPLVGLDVTVIADHYSPALMAMLESITALAATTCLHVTSWGNSPDSILFARRGEPMRTLEEHFSA